MSKQETETTELSEKKIQLSNFDLRKIKDRALFLYKNYAPSPRMDAEAFTTFIWTKAVTDHLINQGYEVPEVEQEGKRL